MKKKLALITAICILTAAATLPAGAAIADDDPPVWGVCPVGTTVCPAEAYEADTALTDTTDPVAVTAP